jgi:tRNA pseudouridine55 synthase
MHLGRKSPGPSGLVLIDKPSGPTSFAIVQAVRRAVGVRRCGHTGTLDPFATGLLPVCLGQATRLARFITASVKVYRAVVNFGLATDTYDLTGRPHGERRPVQLSRETIEPLLASFEGVQKQVPPPFSAKKIDGQRSYRLARAGAAVVSNPVSVTVRRLSLLSLSGERALIETEVESGTYIRSLANDLGERLGCGAHLEELRRIRVGPFGVEQAVSLEELEALAGSGRVGEALIAPLDALPQFPAVALSLAGAARASHGAPLAASAVEVDLARFARGENVRLVGPDGVLVAVAEVRDGELQPLVVLARQS